MIEFTLYPNHIVRISGLFTFDIICSTLTAQMIENRLLTRKEYLTSVVQITAKLYE